MSQRVAGATVFSVLLTFAFLAVPLLRDGRVDFGSVVGCVVVTWSVGYLTWPGLADTWASRDRRDDGRRVVWIGGGLLAGLALSWAVDVFIGRGDAIWAFLVVAVTLATLAVIVISCFRRGHRP